MEAGVEWSGSGDEERKGVVLEWRGRGVEGVGKWSGVKSAWRCEKRVESKNGVEVKVRGIVTGSGRSLGSRGNEEEGTGERRWRRCGAERSRPRSEKSGEEGREVESPGWFRVEVEERKWK